MDEKKTTLAAPGELAPEPRVAGSLESAGNRDLVYVDRHGQARSAAHYRVAQAALYASMAAVIAGGLALEYSLIGLASLPLMGAVSLVALLPIRRMRRMRRGMRLLMSDRFDDAAAQFQSLIDMRLIPRRVRSMAEQNLALCRRLQGRHEEALALYRAAQRGSLSGALNQALARNGEVLVLVNLGRLGEARARFLVLGDEPAGDYLRVQRWMVELYLALAEGRHGLDADELHRRARVALGITAAGPLLGLLAWAFDRIGDRDMAEHLRSEALDRHPGARMALSLPLLEAWLRGGAPPAAGE